MGDAAQTPITQVAVTGPEYQNGTIDTSDPTAFQTSDPVTISSPYFYSYVNQLSFHITAKSGYYFGRTCLKETVKLSSNLLLLSPSARSHMGA